MLTSVVGAYYYLRIVKVMYFDEPVGAARPRDRRTSSPLVIAGTGLFTLLFCLFPAADSGRAAAAAASLLASVTRQGLTRVLPRPAT